MKIALKKIIMSVHFVAYLYVAPSNFARIDKNFTPGTLEQNVPLAALVLLRFYLVNLILLIRLKMSRPCLPAEILSDRYQLFC